MNKQDIIAIAEGLKQIAGSPLMVAPAFLLERGINWLKTR